MFAKSTITLVMASVMTLATSNVRAAEKLIVMTSGGFAHVYNAVLPEFERTTGIAVTTLSGASQGSGPKTVKSQLEHGVEADVVILSREGLNGLIAAGLIAEGSEVPLATTPRSARANPSPISATCQRSSGR